MAEFEHRYPRFETLYRCIQPVTIPKLPAETFGFCAEADGDTPSTDTQANSSGPEPSHEVGSEGNPTSTTDSARQLLHTCRVLVVGAGGLGCEILKDLALSGFRDISVIDMDTIDVSNLNRQFLFRPKDVGQSKAYTAAAFVTERIDDVKVTPYHCKIQDKDWDFYSKFQIVICGLDSVEARRWMNAFLIDMADFDDPDSIIPLVDGGTEDEVLDTDNPVHLQWVYKQALARASTFQIPGVTYMLTQGVVKNIIPAIASTNAIIAAACVNEALKLTTGCHPYLDNYMMYTGTDGVYTYTYNHASRPDCPVCGGEVRTLTVSASLQLAELIEQLGEMPDLRLQSPNLRMATNTAPKTGATGLSLYLQSPPQLEAVTHPNLTKRLGDLMASGTELVVTDKSLPVSLSLTIKFTNENMNVEP
ncbi:NEDD8 activating enzyme [Dimargaris cristalligena]|nr:NEDD8 activating enzyme [Dimargaris cristalligena]